MPFLFFGLVVFCAFARGSGLVLWTLSRLTAMRFGSLAFACLAALGLIVSAMVHFSTFVGADPIEILPQIWFLQVVMLLVFIGAGFATKKAEAGTERLSGSFWANAPRWMIWMSVLFFVYALINFAIFVFLMHEGSPTKQEDGTYAVTRKRELVRRINEDEFHHLQALEARGMSGHWLLFYSWALTMLVSSIRRSSAGGRLEIEDRHGAVMLVSSIRRSSAGGRLEIEDRHGAVRELPVKP